MKPKCIMLSVMLGTLCGCAFLKSSRPHALDQYGTGVRDFLQGFVDSQSTNAVDYFFLAGVSRGHGPEFTYAYWMTGSSIIILDLPIPRIEHPIGFGWYANKARIDLATGVVPAQKDIGSSTYLVDLDWTARILRDCLDSGTQIVVRRRPNKAAETSR